MKFILSIVFSPITFLRILLLILFSVIYLPFVILEDKIFKNPASYRFIIAQLWGRTMLLILGVWVIQNNRPLKSNYILMPNHRSWVDIIIFAAESPSAFVAKAEIANWPLLGLAMKAAHAILVQRNNTQSLLATMRKITDTFHSGMAVTVFPEATTYKGPGTKTFKSGTFKIAAKNRIPIIPCAIEYRSKEICWVGKKTFIGHFFKHFWKPIHIVEIKYSEPLIRSNYLELKSQTQFTINRMLSKMQ